MDPATRSGAAKAALDGSALGAGSVAGGAETLRAKGNPRNSPGGQAVDVEMSDASEVIQLDDAAAADGTAVVGTVSCTETGNAMTVSMEGEQLPAPPAAPTNGNLSTVVGSKHRKSVSFVLEGASVDAVLGGISDTTVSIGDEAVPPLPPVSLESEDVDKGNATGANEALLRRNFSLAGDPQQVTIWFRIGAHAVDYTI